MTRNQALLALAVATAAGTIALLVAPSQLVWLRTLVGVPFIMLLPGSAAMLVVDPDGRLDVTEWLTLAVATSIAIATLTTMGLAITLGLTTKGLVFALAILTLATLLIALIKMPAEQQSRTLPKRRRPVWRVTFGALALLGVTLLALAFSIPDPSVARTGQVVQLWGLPDASGGGLRVGTTNVNAASHTYQLTIRQGGRTISQRAVDLPTGTSHVFVVKKTALLSTTEPVTAELADTSGANTPRTISVWTTK